MDILESEQFMLIAVPLMIFFLRIIDVSLGTLRIIFVSKGFKLLAPIIGFFEILIWIFVVSRVMGDLSNWVSFVAYAGGFATGNFVGMKLEEKLAIGHELVRVITRREATDLIGSLKTGGYGVTSVEAMGVDGEVSVLYVIINRKKLPEVLKIIREYNPRALYTVEDIRKVSREVFYGDSPVRRSRLFK